MRFRSVARFSRVAALRLLVVLIGTGGPALAAERVFDFLGAREGETPHGFRSTMTGHGSNGVWRVVMRDVPPVVAPLSEKSPAISRRAVLGQLSKEANETRAPLLVYDNESFNDFSFTTRFQIASGKIEQMAGLAFRLQDEWNYYYVRVNAKE